MFDAEDFVNADMQLIKQYSKQRDNLFDNEITATAIFSDCKRYRYFLDWLWSDKPAMHVCMLNPSTADAFKLDPTISGLVKRAKLWGYGGVKIVNLFAFRATDPKEMKKQSEPIGKYNDAFIRSAIASAINQKQSFIVGWGEHGKHMNRWCDFTSINDDLGALLQAFEVNKSGQPKHPLYCSHHISPKPWAMIKDTTDEHA